MALPALTEPQRLWWLLLLPVLYWLSLPPRPRRQLVTAHLPQWLHAIAALRRRPVRFRRWRCFLLLLAAAAAVLAYSGPELPGKSGPQRLVVLLDGSMSMAAEQPDGGTAHAAALALMRQRLAALPANVDVTLLCCGASLQRRHDAAARAALDVPPPAGANAIPLRELASGIAAADTAVWTLTDAQGEESVPTVGALSVFGRPLPNAAIVGLDATDRWPLPEFELQVELLGCSDAPLRGVLEVGGAVQPVESVAVDLPAAARIRLPLRLQRLPAGGRVDLRLRCDRDALPADDVVQIELPPLPAPGIAMLGEEPLGPLLTTAAATLADEVSGKVVAATASNGIGFLLVEGGVVAIEPGAVRALCFGTRAPLAAAEPEPWIDPVVVDWDREHPITAGLDLSELRVTQALRGILPVGHTLVSGAVPGGGSEPLVVLCQGPGRASVHCAFRLQDSNLGLLPAFPQLLRRAFLAAYGLAGTGITHGPLADPDEADLRRRRSPADRPLPEFGSAGRSLAALLLLSAAASLALRALLR